MTKPILKYGSIACLVLVGIPLLSSLFLENGPEDFRIGEIVGYSTMIIALMLILVAQNDYRKQLNQPLKYSQGLVMGLAISALAGSAFGLYNLVYIAWINPEFMDQYYGYYIENLKQSGGDPAQIKATIEKINSEKEMWMSPAVQFFGMFFTVFVIGLIVSLISAGFMAKLSRSANKRHEGK